MIGIPFKKQLNTSRNEYAKSTVAEDGNNTKKKLFAYIKQQKQGITGVSLLHDQHDQYSN